MLTDDDFFQQTGFGESKTFFGGQNLRKYIMGLGQGSRAAPPSWIQVIAVLVNVYKQLELGGYITDLLSKKTIHTIGAVFVDNTDLYTGGEDSVKPFKLWRQTQTNVNQWNNLLQATGGALKPEKCFGYLIDFNCK